ncbi:MAG: glycosyltransferase [Alphaproteobacteria bacterium]|nr:glycosyltransferase [Alphaproteobacteria bacterium]
MHILIVADHGWINGGQAKVAIESALGLAGRGHRVTFLAAVGPLDARLARAGIETVCLEQVDIDTASSRLGFVRQYMWNAKAAATLKQLLADMDPAQSVVHVHAWAKAISPSIGPVLKSTSVPAVYTMHEFFMVCPTGGFYDYRKGETCRLAPMSRACISTNCDSRSYPRKLMRVARQASVFAGGLRHAFRDVIFISDMQFAAAQMKNKATDDDG